ncbi:hypothetical protein E8E12_000553 [Didymella heteroderae]|uniref:Sequence-specific DNA binding RNA polymerase II transcription factor n=1 Tax=Didymella heteroderae TaxID=1769908 RepID=A0A9P4WG48_9PLEO|nr:hypothetical protein E8E12_000553 [Didymella heteroderae]
MTPQRQWALLLMKFSLLSCFPRGHSPSLPRQRRRAKRAREAQQAALLAAASAARSGGAPAPPPASSPAAPPTPPRPAPGARRLVPCAYCVDALLARSSATRSSAALCVDNSASGRRSKRCFRCASGHSCKPLPEVLEPLGIELVEELVRSGGTTTPRVTELRGAIRTMKGLIEDGYLA